jgi:hypothetical protein
MTHTYTQCDVVSGRKMETPRYVANITTATHLSVPQMIRLNYVLIIATKYLILISPNKSMLNHIEIIIYNAFKILYSIYINNL